MRKFIPITILLSASALTFIGVAKTNQVIETHAGYDKASLPTTIDLNSVKESDVRNYYSALNSLSDSDKTGNNLLKSLKPILMDNQKYYSYDVSSGKDIWKMYEITDRDWDKSPASEISGYNASTNIITGYKYGDSKNNSGTNPYIHALYVNRDVDNKVHAWAVEDGSRVSHGDNAEWCIDREHIWPKSLGFEDSNDDPGTSGARGDPMHLWAGDSYVNSALHSNYFYGYVDTTKDYTDGKDQYAYDKGNLKGTSKTLGGNVTVFEPQDSDKGDIARAVFYMVARYNDLAGNDTIENDNPNLELTNNLSDWKAKGYISTSSNTGKLGILSDLLEWNKLDPVDDYEIRRNDILYRNFTNNRNPFIDFPEWADYIWGEGKGSSYANPTTDSINGSPVKVTTTDGKDFSGSVDLGTEVTIQVNADPGTTITWTIEDSTIARIDSTGDNSAKIVPVKVGTTKLTIKATVNGKEETRTISLKIVDKSAPADKPTFNLDIKTIIIIAAIALVVLIIVILFLAFASKKTKKKAKKLVKKAVKSSNKKSGGKKK